ncbi:MAG: phospholipase D-like domain-containing protein, partial [Eubacteriales bacterium]
MKKIEEKQTNRLIATALNILLQLVIICLILLYFSELFVYYYVISFALAILMCVSVINKKTNSGYKIAWIVLLLAIPIFGVALYLMLGGGITRTRTGKKMLKITEDIKDNFSDEEEVAFDDEYAKMQSEYIRRYSYSPPVKNTRCRYFTGGEAYFEALLGDLKTAEKTIYMEYFIIKESYMWSEITDILIDKASKGVDVKVIYDGVGSMDRISKAELKRLTKAGIKIKAFNIFVPIISSIQNNRDHRKICTIDSKIAYCGGVNIADEYINRESKFGHFKDSGIALYGEATYNFEVFFLTLWKYVSGEDVSINKQKYEQFDEGIYQPYTDSPIDAEYIGKNI